MFLSLPCSGPSSARRSDHPLEILHLLQLSRSEALSRLRIRRALRRLRRWQRRARDPQSSLRASLREEYVGRALRRQAGDALLRHRMIRDTRISLFEAYIANLPCLGHSVPARTV